MLTKIIAPGWLIRRVDTTIPMEMIVATLVTRPLELSWKSAPTTLAAAGRPDSTKTYNFQLYLGPKDNHCLTKTSFTPDWAFSRRSTSWVVAVRLRWYSPWLLEYWQLWNGCTLTSVITALSLSYWCSHEACPSSDYQKKSGLNEQNAKGPKRAPGAGNKKEYSKPYGNAETDSCLSKGTWYFSYESIYQYAPMFLQMPIWIALWSAVYTSIDLRGAAFLPFWITNLSAPDALVKFSTLTIPLINWKIDSLNLCRFWWE